MKRIMAIIFMGLFMFQAGVKTAIVFYYHSFDTSTAKENCEYKTLTICKGSCYVTKQIKIVSSSSNKETQQSAQIDLNSLKDVTCYNEHQNSFSAGLFYSTMLLIGYNEKFYSYNYSSDLIKPPCA